MELAPADVVANTNAACIGTAASLLEKRLAVTIVIWKLETQPQPRMV